MESTLEIRILLQTDQDALMAYARHRLEQTETEPMDIEMKTWVARWRGESCAYYLPQGWSFGVFDGKNQMKGFLLGQPLIFFRGLTQTLWIEELMFDSPEGGELLLETAYKWARDKHLQCVLLENRAERKALVEQWKHAHQNEEPMIELRSSKF